jgi:hypothetical protein
MLVEMREYSLVPGSVKDFVKTYEEKGWSIQSAVLGNCVGWYTTEVGDLNGIVHLWSYRDIEDREKRRELLSANPQWLEFLTLIRPFLRSTQNRLLRPASFAIPRRVEHL